MVLLCGFLGLGKIILVYVIVCYVGYFVVEMNVSDDCSLEVF